MLFKNLENDTDINVSDETECIVYHDQFKPYVRLSENQALEHDAVILTADYISENEKTFLKIQDDFVLCKKLGTDSACKS